MQSPLAVSISQTCNIKDMYDIESFDNPSSESALGSGTFGVVSKARAKLTGEHVAVKAIKLIKCKEESIASEIDIMKSLDHPNIIKLLDTYLNSTYVFLVVELGAGGDLFDRILNSDSEHFTEGEALHCMSQIFQAVMHCHLQHICVRSIKPEDVVCMTQHRTAQVALKLVDFGISTRLKPGDYLTSKVGTPYYIAPQVLAGHYDHACDVWSCGVMMYTMCCGYPPFYGESDRSTLQKIASGEYSFKLADWKHVSDASMNLVRKLLEMNPADRYTANEALQALSSPLLDAQDSSSPSGYSSTSVAVIRADAATEMKMQEEGDKLPGRGASKYLAYQEEPQTPALEAMHSQGVALQEQLVFSATERNSEGHLVPVAEYKVTGESRCLLGDIFNEHLVPLDNLSAPASARQVTGESNVLLGDMFNEALEELALAKDLTLPPESRSPSKAASLTEPKSKSSSFDDDEEDLMRRILENSEA